MLTSSAVCKCEILHVRYMHFLFVVLGVFPTPYYQYKEFHIVQ